MWLSTNDGLIQAVAWACSAFSLVMATFAAWFLRDDESVAPMSSTAPRLSSRLLTVSVNAVVIAVTIQGVTLAVRAAHVGVDMLNGFPGVEPMRFGFGLTGLSSLVLMAASLTLTYRVSGDSHMLTGLFGVLSLAGVWGSLLPSPLRVEASGGYEQTGSTLVTVATLSVLLAVTGALAHRVQSADMVPSMARTEVGPPRTTLPPGLAVGVGVVATLLIVLICFHLAVPIASDRVDFRRGTLALAGSAVIASWGCFQLLDREWHVAVAEAAFGLASMALCAASAAVIPTRPGLLATQYPMLFNAMIVGLAASAALWTKLALGWQEAVEEGPDKPFVRGLIPVAKRIAFLSAALALLIGLVMAVWPRWPAIATMDHSIGRVTAGFSANLFLLLVLLWCSRHLRRPTFHVLTVLSVLVTAGFLMVRVMPFTPMFG